MELTYGNNPEYIERNLLIAPSVGMSLWLTGIHTLIGKKDIDWEYCIPEEKITGQLTGKINSSAGILYG